MKGFKVIIISLELWQKGKMRLSSAEIEIQSVPGSCCLGDSLSCPVLSRRFWCFHAGSNLPWTSHKADGKKEAGTDGQAEATPRMFPREPKKT